MAETDGDKLFDPTPRRRQEARERGQVANSPELSGAVLLLAGLLAAVWLGGAVMGFLGELMRRQLGGDAWVSVESEFLLGQWGWISGGLARTLLPLLLLLSAAAIAVQLAQVGLRFAPHRALPDFSRIHPGQGIQRMFSGGSAGRLAMGLVKLVVVGAVVLLVLQAKQHELLALTATEAPQLARAVADLVFTAGLQVGLALLALAGVDYLWRRWRLEQDLRMTRQELQEEMKDLQGGGRLKQRRR